MRLRRLFFGVGLIASAQTRVVDFTIRENTGVERKGVLAQQGVPAPARDGSFVVLDAGGQVVPATVERERQWLRVALPVDLGPWEAKKFTLAYGSAAPEREVKITQAAGNITVSAANYTATFNGKDRFRLE